MEWLKKTRFPCGNSHDIVIVKCVVRWKVVYIKKKKKDGKWFILFPTISIVGSGHCFLYI